MTRIAIGGIHIESSIFTPYRSGEKDFTVLRGQEILDTFTWMKEFSSSQPDGVETGIDWLPLIHARALPGGIVEHQFYLEWEREFFNGLQEHHSVEPIDILLLELHGAATVEGITDVEGLIARRCREVLGDKVIISTSLDLHGNISEELFEASDLITAYRTAPHIDTVETRTRAAVNAVALFSDRRVGKPWYGAKVDVPILLPGEKTSTEVEPGRSLYQSIDTNLDGDAVRDIAILMGFPWADEERNHGVVVAYGTDKTKVEQAAAHVGELFLSLKEDFAFVGPAAAVTEAIDTALNSSDSRPFFISDTGDNPGAGGTGDSTNLLEPLLNRVASFPGKVLYTSIYDPEFVDEVWDLEVGAESTHLLGGKQDEFSSPVRITGSVSTRTVDPRGGKTIVFDTQSVRIVVTEKRNQYSTNEQYARLDLSFDDFDVVAVKMGYLEPDQKAAAQGWVMALSSGAVNQDLRTLDYTNLRRPLFPFDQSETHLEVAKSLKTIE